MKINFNGIIGWDITAESLIEKLPENNEPVDIQMNSDGGDVIEAFAIYNALKNYKGGVSITVNAIAASAAAYLIFAADKIKVYDNSIIMIHRAWAFTCGNAVEMREEAALLESLDNIMAADYAAVTGKDKAEALAGMEKDIWLIGAEAILSHGIKCERIDYEKDEQNVKMDEAQARTRYAAMVEKLKAAGRPVSRNKILALLKNKPADSAGRRAKAMTKEELIEQLEADEELKKAVLEWAKEQTAGDDADEPPKAEDPEPEPPKDDDPEKEPPAENKAAAERRRVSQILALAGGTMTARAKSAIERGVSAADFLVQEQIAERTAQAQGGGNTNTLGKPSAPQTFAGLAGKGKTDGDSAVVTDDDKLRAMAKRM
jgi:ATP-dependent protease ClpP protease subunit